MNILLKFCLPPLAAVFIALPFLDKAVHIDDTLFLYMARQILKYPLDPYSFFVNWEYATERAFDFFSNPPGMGYFLAFVLSRFGENERVLHASYLIFSIPAGYSMAFLARRFTPLPSVALLLLFFSPIFMITSHNLMPDMPLLALYLSSLALFIRGAEREKTFPLLLSGIFAGIALLFRYNGISLLALLFFYHLLYHGFTRPRHFIALIAPVAILCGWCVLSQIAYGEVHLLKHIGFQQYGQGTDLARVKLFLLANFLYLAGGALFPLVLLSPFFAGAGIMNKLIFFLPLVLFGFLYRKYNGYLELTYNIPNTILLSTFFVALSYFLMAALKESCMGIVKRNEHWRDPLFLLFWFFLVIGIQTSGIHTSAKYMLLAVPPLILLFVRSLSVDMLQSWKGRILITLLLLFSTGWGFLMAAADYELAGVNRKIARYCEDKIKIGKENTLWFLGHWGFQYYMEEKGFRAYEAQSELPKKGDVLVRSSLAWPQPMSPQLKSRIVLKDKMTLYARLPVKTMHNQMKSLANFYSTENFRNGPRILPSSIPSNPLEEFLIFSMEGVLPFSISSNPLEEFLVFSVE